GAVLSGGLGPRRGPAALGGGRRLRDRAPRGEHRGQAPRARRAARARPREERVQLADLLPEVFVTGARDFGPDVPVGRLTASWLMRLKERLPAKAAAIEAA